jgi:DNA-directed RNA polymerase alpha subunit
MTNNIIQVDAKGVFDVLNQKTPLEKMPISERLKNLLRQERIFTIEQLARTDDLGAIRGLGRTSVMEAVKLLSRHGISSKWDKDGFSTDN